MRMSMLRFQGGSAAQRRPHLQFKKITFGVLNLRRCLQPLDIWCTDRHDDDSARTGIGFDKWGLVDHFYHSPRLPGVGRLLAHMRLGVQNLPLQAGALEPPPRWTRSCVFELHCHLE